MTETKENIKFLFEDKDKSYLYDKKERKYMFYSWWYIVLGIILELVWWHQYSDLKRSIIDIGFLFIIGYVFLTLGIFVLSMYYIYRKNNNKNKILKCIIRIISGVLVGIWLIPLSIFTDITDGIKLKVIFNNLFSYVIFLVLGLISCSLIFTILYYKILFGLGLNRIFISMLVTLVIFHIMANIFTHFYLWIITYKKEDGDIDHYYMYNSYLREVTYLNYILIIIISLIFYSGMITAEMLPNVKQIQENIFYVTGILLAYERVLNYRKSMHNRKYSYIELNYIKEELSNILVCMEKYKFKGKPSNRGRVKINLELPVESKILIYAQNKKEIKSIYAELNDLNNRYLEYKEAFRIVKRLVYKMDKL